MMSPYDSLSFMHVNLHREVRILRGQILAYHFSAANESVLIYTAGGALFPVKETLEEVERIISSAAKEPTIKEA